jgi:hypothetical protein
MRRLLCNVALLAALHGCGDPAIPDDGPVAVEALTMTGVDPQTGRGQYEVAVVTLETVVDVPDLVGKYVRVLRDGELEINQVTGSLVRDGRALKGEPADLRYRVVDGVVVPRDYSSLVMLSAFHQFERVILALDQVAGESFADMSAGWPALEVFFEPIIRASGDIDISAAMKFNAFYLPGEKQFGLAQRSPLERVPLAANLLVISHEFGHLLFERYFFRDENPGANCDEREGPKTVAERMAFEYTISGFNEGFADFISFAVSGGTHVFADVEEFFGDDRSLTHSSFVFAELPGACRNQFYCVGTLLARSLFEAMPDLGLEPGDPEDRAAMARAVVGAVAGALDVIEAQPEQLPSELGLGVRSCRPGSWIATGFAGNAAAYHGAVAGAFLGAFAAALPQDYRGAVCQRFADNFGEVGFPVEDRGVCQ